MNYRAKSFNFFSGVTLTFVEAGLRGTSMNFPGLNGLGTFFRAGRAAFLTVVILSSPGSVNSPAARFLT